MIFLLFSISLDSLVQPYGIDNINFEYKAYWSRFPSPGEIPYTFAFFKGLYKEPIKVLLMARSSANIVEDYLKVSYKKSDKIYHLLYSLGVDRFISGFRDYSPNFSPYVKNEKGALYNAVKRIQIQTAKQENLISFGGEYDTLPQLKGKLSKIPLSLQYELATLIDRLHDSYQWIVLGLRNVDFKTRVEIFNTRDADLTQSDGMKYYPHFDDCMKKIDYRSLFYGALKAASASEIAARRIDSIMKVNKYNVNFDITIPTSIGDIMILGTNSKSYHIKNALLVVDLGGNDTYTGNIGASGLSNPLSVFIDIAGDDKYETNDSLENAQGVGVLGTGVLIDETGNDQYNGGKISQGSGIFGVGILFDNNGYDKYKGYTQTQGYGLFGIGMLIDRVGDDNYYAFGDCQGDGEMHGIGVLCDRYGNDTYKAEPYSRVYNRGDYHSKQKINANNAQGFGGGRRGDGSDGHSWAGGLGMLIDISGNDRYIAGNWAQGVGYWLGTGILYDRNGDDYYNSCYFTQGSGAHYCIGALIDENGNDVHKLFETAGAALGFGWDWTFALFLDYSGNDKYNEKMISMGVAEINSIALFLELDGDDEYIVSNAGLRLGASDFRKYYKEMPRHTFYPNLGKNIGIFIDAGGKDKYYEVDKKWEQSLSKRYKNNKKWMEPPENSEKFGYRNLGIGIDMEGKINDIQ